MAFFVRSADLSPLLVVRTVDRERTIGIFVVLEEHEPERRFVASQIMVKGGARLLAPEVTPAIFSGCVDEVPGYGTATSLTRRVKYQQIGFYSADLMPVLTGT